MKRRRNPCGCSSHAFACVLLALSIASTAIAVDGLPTPNKQISPNGDDEDATNSTAAAKNATIFTSFNENYQSSLRVTKMMEDEFKERQRQYWERTLEDIKESAVRRDAAQHRLMHERRKSGEKILERWKQFLDSGGSARPTKEEGISLDGSDEAEADVGGSGTDAKTTPPRFDGFLTWEKQLQQWSEDVSLYLTGLAEQDIQLNELLQPRETSRYDLGKFGMPASPKNALTREEIDKEGRPLPGRDKEHVPNPKSPKSFSPLGLTAAPGTLPVTLTALDKSLPPIPKPRPVTPDDEILPHTDIADKSKNIWIVTTGALPWMTGTAVNPLLRAAYLSAGRKEAGGSVTIMLPWVEKTEDQKKIYGGEERRFETPGDQEEYIRGWLRDTANMEEASRELGIEWYTAWQEVLENSLYSMGDLIGLIPVSGANSGAIFVPQRRVSG